MLRRARLFPRDAKGLAAVEFALILPVLLTMLFGMGELEMALGARADVAAIASTVADLVAQESTLTTADVSNVYNAANTLLYPYYTNTSGLKPSIRISSVIYNTTTKDLSSGTVQWSCTQAGSGALPALGASKTFDQQLMTASGSVIMVEVAYSYASPTTQVVAGAIKMNNTFYTKPRRVLQIPAPTCP